MLKGFYQGCRAESRRLPFRNCGYAVEYLLFVEVLKTELKLLIFGFHSFAQFLKNLEA